MPQLDKVTFYIQYSGMIYTFLLFHLMIRHLVFINVIIHWIYRKLIYKGIRRHKVGQEISLNNIASKERSSIYGDMLWGYIINNTLYNHNFIASQNFSKPFSYTSKKSPLEQAKYEIQNEIFFIENNFLQESYNYLLKKNFKLNAIELNLKNEA